MAQGCQIYARCLLEIENTDFARDSHDHSGSIAVVVKDGHTSSEFSIADGRKMLILTDTILHHGVLSKMAENPNMLKISVEHTILFVLYLLILLRRLWSKNSMFKRSISC